uniref:Uncharacterized protein n=1 Tax=Aegilops tauschii subsp. strangulata TaxID=200361 RepID=A0A453NUW1_AEGTS
MALARYFIVNLEIQIVCHIIPTCISMMFCTNLHISYRCKMLCLDELCWPTEFQNTSVNEEKNCTPIA